MERRRGRVLSEQDAEILAKPPLGRRRMFEQAFGDLLALQQERARANIDLGKAVFQPREEEILIGRVLRLRRLGVMPQNFRVSFEEVEEGSLDVSVQRNGGLPLTCELRTVSAQRPPELTEILEATLRSLRNKRN